MLRLDHNRALSQLAAKASVPVGATSRRVVVWGNHSPTMYADYRFATAHGKLLKDLINDENWNRNEFLPKVGKRGAAIIEARGTVVRRLGRERGHRPRPRLARRHERQVGDDGRGLRRQLRHPEGRDVRVPRDHGQAAGMRSCRACRSTSSRASRMNATLKELEEERAGVASLLG